MCGIAGIICKNTQGIDAGWIDSINSSLWHRGPDDYGFLSWSQDDNKVLLAKNVEAVHGKHVAMLHRRLSILDLSSAGWQPMVTSDGRYAIVFNGEVYNFLELREELLKLGYFFKSDTDTEVVLAALQEWGIEVLNRFVGMFAFSLLDKVERTLTLARDPFGIKPLYWAKWNGNIVFSSEIPALIDLPLFEKKVNPQAVYEYLRHGATDRGESTLFNSVYRVKSGSYIKFNIDTMQADDSKTYWNLCPETTNISFGDAVDKLRQLFLKSVKLHLRSDVPIGIALSGGIDSTSILGAASHLGFADKINAFSFISSDAKQSEEKWIDLASSYYGVSVHKIHLTESDFIDDIIRVIRVQGEPFATTGMLAQERVFNRVHSLGIKVTLDGQGADEILAGYPTYLAAKLADSLSDFNLDSLDYIKAGGVSCLTRAIGMMLDGRAAELARYLVGEQMVPPWLNVDWFASRNVNISPVLIPRRRDRLHDRLEQTVTDLSLPALLRYADRNSMINSIESRVPFLTTEFAEFALSLPSQYLISKNGTTKSVFRAAMRGLVPDQILDRRDKIGFSVPESAWLRGSNEWVKEQIRSAINLLPMLKHSEVLSQVEKIEKGAPISNSAVWRCVNLSVWADMFGVQF